MRAFIMSNGTGLSERLLAIESRLPSLEDRVTDIEDILDHHNAKITQHYERFRVVLGVDPQAFEGIEPPTNVWGKFMRLEAAITQLMRKLARVCNCASALFADEERGFDDMNNEFLQSLN